MKSKKIILSVVICVLVLFVFVLWFAGWFMTKSANRKVGNFPADLKCENVEFQSKSNSLIKGWLVRGGSEKGVVILMHGVRANRSDMIERMKFLNQAGFTVLSFDFQAHGESVGETITFGHLESSDSSAAIDFVKNKFPNEKVGVIGISMGGAAFLISDNKSKADAVILEMVYSTMQQAIDNRLNMWVFNGAEVLSPLLTFQFKPRLGFSIDNLRPIDKIKDVRNPVLFIVGEKDLNTTIAESQKFYEAANQPKEFYEVPNASHQDLHKMIKADYEMKVLKFLNRNLSN